LGKLVNFGRMIIQEAESIEEIEKEIKNDPFIVNGILLYNTHKFIPNINKPEYK